MSLQQTVAGHWTCVGNPRITPHRKERYTLHLGEDEELHKKNGWYTLHTEKRRARGLCFGWFHVSPTIAFIIVARWWPLGFQAEGPAQGGGAFRCCVRPLPSLELGVWFLQDRVGIRLFCQVLTLSRKNLLWLYIFLWRGPSIQHPTGSVPKVSI